MAVACCPWCGRPLHPPIATPPGAQPYTASQSPSYTFAFFPSPALALFHRYLNKLKIFIKKKTSLDPMRPLMQTSGRNRLRFLTLRPGIPEDGFCAFRSPKTALPDDLRAGPPRHVSLSDHIAGEMTLSGRGGWTRHPVR